MKERKWDDRDVNVKVVKKAPPKAILVDNLLREPEKDLMREIAREREKARERRGGGGGDETALYQNIKIERIYLLIKFLKLIGLFYIPIAIYVII